MQRQVHLVGRGEQLAITKRGLYVLLQTALQPTTFTRTEAQELATALQTTGNPVRVAHYFSSKSGSALDSVLLEISEDLWTQALAADCTEGRAQPYENRLVLIPGDVFCFAVIFAGSAGPREVSYEIVIC